MEENPIFIRQLRKGSSSPQVHIMSTPNSQCMTGRQETKQLWIGLVEVLGLKNNQVLTGAKGAFVNLVTWACDADEFRGNAELVLRKLGLFTVDVENPEPVSIRRNKAEFDEETEDMIARAENNPKAIIYGTFHTWKRDAT
jgi:hypothetical protein